MKKQCEDRDALPAGWLEELHEKADLEHAFALLRPVRHFYAETWKGRLRSFQMRWDSAWKHFDRAYKLTEDCEETIPNLVRQFVLNIWCFENALLESPLEEDGSKEIEEAWIPDLPEEVLQEYPEVRFVIRMRRQSEALLRLHLRHFNDAAEIYRDLIETLAETPRNAGNDGMLHLGLAAAEHNLGFADRAEREMENAGLSVATAGRALERLHVGSFLVAFHRYLKREDDAASWKTFLERIESPEATRSLYLRRADMLLERFQQAKALVIF